MKGLIVTADDFGAAVEVNEAIERAHCDGILTATSLMVSGPAAADAVARAKRLPSLRVGLHIVLTEGRPTLPADAVRDLIGEDGLFRSDMAPLGAAIFFRPHVRRQMKNEVAAQFEAFAATGIKLDHVNAHRHFHLHPTIASAILEIGAGFGLRAARVPHEPLRVINTVEPGTVSLSDRALHPFTALLNARFRAAGLMVPDHVFGLKWTGMMTACRLRGLIDHLPPGLNEIYLHPAIEDAFAGSTPNYRYREEFAALTDDAVAAKARAAPLRLGGFADFPPRR